MDKDKLIGTRLDASAIRMFFNWSAKAAWQMFTVQ